MDPGEVRGRLRWSGCRNVRDLTALPASRGLAVRPAALVRADNPASLAPDGWVALAAHGIRTVVLLRTEGDDPTPSPDPSSVPDDIDLITVHLEDGNDPTFVERCVDTGRFMTPLHLGDLLELAPDRCATAVAAVARARPGGVLVSCGRGRDRTGVVTALLLALCEVPPATIAEDWQLAVDTADELEPGTAEIIEAILSSHGSSVDRAIADALTADVGAALVATGRLQPADIERLRRRLLAPA